MLLNLTNVAVYVPEIVSSGTNLGGTTAAFDGNGGTGNVYNAKADWDAQATMPNPTGRIRINGISNWGNVNGSFNCCWVSECTVRVLG